MLRGFDVSHYQGAFNWQRAATRYKLSFGFCKATEAESSIDAMFTYNWHAIADAGLIRGAYNFARPDQNANDDADRFLALVNPTRVTDLLVLDLEVSTMSASATADWAVQWADRISTQTKYTPGLYCGGFMHVNAYAKLADHFGYWWYPRYPSRFANVGDFPTLFNPVPPLPNVWGTQPDFWQFSGTFDTGQDTDANLYAGTLNSLAQLNKRLIAPPTTPVPPVDPKPAPVKVLPKDADMIMFSTPSGFWLGWPMPDTTICFQRVTDGAGQAWVSGGGPYMKVPGAVVAELMSLGGVPAPVGLAEDDMPVIRAGETRPAPASRSYDSYDGDE